jgi:cell division protein FtsI/penicillin-binding protein 2
VQIQAITATEYRKEAERQRMSSIELPPKRGAILDRNGDKLAVSVMMDTIYVTPYLIDDKEAFARKIAPILKQDERELTNKLIKQTGFAYLVRKTDSKTVQAVKDVVKKEDIKGVGFIKESDRYFPNNTLGAQVVGFTGMDNHGLGGIENYYDDVLYGTPGRIIAERDAKGHPIPQTIESSTRPKDGWNIRISIDTQIQYRAETELNATIQKYKAKSGNVMVMNPETGEIYAMAGTPSFNPNDLKTIKNGNARNISVTDLYEPGSTLKTMIACGALQESVCRPSTSFYLEPTIRVGSKRIKDSHPRPAVTYTLSQIIQQSSNVGMVKVGMLMGKEKIIKYLEKFAFGKKSGIDFPGEARGFYPSEDNWSKMSLANIPFGQGISTTQLRMATAYAAIANDGIPVRPHFLLDETNSRGRVIASARIVKEEPVLDPETCRQMKRILEGAVVKGTGGEAKIANYRVGGKTGTAQKAKVGGRGYDKGKYVASFIGMVPIEDPKLVIAVVIDEPQANIYGGSVAAPVFSKVGEFALRYLKIPPD